MVVKQWLREQQFNKSQGSSDRVLEAWQAHSRRVAQNQLKGGRLDAYFSMKQSAVAGMASEQKY